MWNLPCWFPIFDRIGRITAGYLYSYTIPRRDGNSHRLDSMVDTKRTTASFQVREHALSGAGQYIYAWLLFSFGRTRTGSGEFFFPVKDRRRACGRFTGKKQTLFGKLKWAFIIIVFAGVSISMYFNTPEKTDSLYLSFYGHAKAGAFREEFKVNDSTLVLKGLYNQELCIDFATTFVKYGIRFHIFPYYCA